MTDFIPTNEWPKTDQAQKFLLFATRVKELVHPEAQDIYRVHALSTIAKLKELQECCFDVIDGRYPKATLDPIIEETAEAIKTDFIAREIITEKSLDPKPITPTKDQSTEEIGSLCQVWLEFLAPEYALKIETEIINLLRDGNKKTRILVCTKLYTAHLVYRGFHRKFIHDSACEIFFYNKIGRCTDTLIKRFFAKFNSKEEPFSVVMRGPAAATSAIADGKNIVSVSAKEEAESFVGCQLPELIDVNDDRPALILKQLNARDPFTAVSDLSALLSLPPAFNVVYPSVERPELEDQCLVVRLKDHQAITISNREILAPVHSFTSQISYNKSMLRGFAQYIWAGTRSQDHETIDKMMQAMASASAALDASSPQAQLVSIWAAFEAMLPPPTRDGREVRINHFSRLIYPCIARKYLRGKFRIFLDDVSRHSKGNILEVIGEEIERPNRPRELAKILLHETPERQKLFEKLADSPLMLNRLYSLVAIIQDPKLAKKKLELHEQRVNWQIHRIYRERNRVVHSGASRDFLPTLVENCFLYFRLTVRALQYVHNKYGVYEPHGALQLIRGLYERDRADMERIIQNGDRAERREQAIDLLFRD